MEWIDRGELVGKEVERPSYCKLREAVSSLLIKEKVENESTKGQATTTKTDTSASKPASSNNKNATNPFKTSPRHRQTSTTTDQNQCTEKQASPSATEAEIS